MNKKLNLKLKCEHKQKRHINVKEHEQNMIERIICEIMLTSYITVSTTSLFIKRLRLLDLLVCC